MINYHVTMRLNWFIKTVYPTIFTIIPLLLLIPRQYTIYITDNIIYYLVIFVAIIFAPLYIQTFKSNMKNSITFRLLHIYILVNALIIPFSINSSYSVLVFWLQYSFVIIYSSISHFVTHQIKQQFLISLIGVALVLSVISFYNTLILQYRNTDSDGVSFMWVYFDHNHLSAILLLAIPSAVYFLKKYWTSRIIKLGLLFVITLFIGSLLLTFARASIISLGVVLLLTFWFVGSQKLRLFKLSLLSVFMVGVLAAVYFIFPVIYNSNKSIGFNSRTREMVHGLHNFVNHPYQGTGLGTFRYTKTKKYQFSTDFSHNFVVDLLSDTGLISTSLFLSFLIIQLSQSVSKIRKNLRNDDSVITLVFLVGLVGLLINNMVDFDLQIISVGLLFWIFIGMINFYNQKNDINLEKNN